MSLMAIPDAVDRDATHYVIKVSERANEYKPKIFSDSRGIVAPYCFYCCGSNPNRRNNRVR